MKFFKWTVCFLIQPPHRHMVQYLSVIEHPVKYKTDDSSFLSLLWQVRVGLDGLVFFAGAPNCHHCHWWPLVPVCNCSEVSLPDREYLCLFQITMMKISPGLYRQHKETFQCHISRCTPIVPPVIITRCYHRILGCQTCMDAWYGGEDGVSRSCPMWWFVRAYWESTTLRGWDDFLRSIQPL